MIDFTRAQLSQLTVHFVGNKGLGEEITLSDKQLENIICLAADRIRTAQP